MKAISHTRFSRNIGAASMRFLSRIFRCDDSSPLSTEVVIADTVACKYSFVIPEETYYAWRLLASTIRLADQRIDSPIEASVRGRRIRRVLRYLSGESTEYIVDDPHLFVLIDGLRTMIAADDRRRRMFLRNLSLLLRITQLIRHTGNIDHLAMLTRLEGQVTAKLFIALLPAYMWRNRWFRDFLTMASNAGRLSNCIDTFIDFNDDYIAGRVLIKPSLGKRIRIAFCTLPDGWAVLRRVNFRLALRSVTWLIRLTCDASSRRSEAG